MLEFSLFTPSYVMRWRDRIIGGQDISDEPIDKRYRDALKDLVNTDDFSSKAELANLSLLISGQILAFLRLLQFIEELKDKIKVS